MRRLNQLLPVRTDIAHREIVTEDEDDVGLPRLSGRTRDEQQREKRSRAKGKGMTTTGVIHGRRER
jgi:hypothetical protein